MLKEKPQLSQAVLVNELRQLLDESRPGSVLRKLAAVNTLGMAVFKAEALFELDQTCRAHEVLMPALDSLVESELPAALLLDAQILIRLGLYDPAILSAQRAAGLAADDDTRAMAWSWTAVGFAHKHCWRSSEAYLRDAIELAPTQPKVLAAQARVRLESDQRLEARRIYERMAGLASTWAQVYSDWGLAYIAYLLGEFDQAQQYAQTALGCSPEILNPLFVLGQVALARADAPAFARVLKMIEQRSPQAESLEGLNAELQKLENRLVDSVNGKRRRLEAFPTLVQRRNFCGPSTVELVLRYWQGSLELTNDEIAERIKYAQSGTPIYRMREFFHLFGFDTLRCRAPIPKLKQLIDAGFPAIVQQEYANSSHVAVVIGYDDAAQTIELQDPMTHLVTAMPVAEFNHLRRNFLEAALVAYPRQRVYEKKLAQMNLFNDAALVAADQAVLEMDQGHYANAMALLERSVNRQPAHGLGWIVLLHASLEEWRLEAQNKATDPDAGMIETARQRFYQLLHKARKHHPEVEFIYQFEGWAALNDQDYLRAQDAFRRASLLDQGDASNRAALAECAFALRNLDDAVEASWQALQSDPTLPAANTWMARSLAGRGEENALHYARVAVELGPERWQAQLALAEAAQQSGDLSLVDQALKRAAALAPAQVEVQIQRAILCAYQGEEAQALRLGETILSSGLPLSPMASFNVHQLLGKLAFGNGDFEMALEISAHMLSQFPGDPWLLQFQAATRCERLLSQNSQSETVDEIRLAYEQAIQANKAPIWLLRDYAGYMTSLVGQAQTRDALAELMEQYPGNNALLYLIARLDYELGDLGEAGERMLQVLTMPGGIQNRDELEQAVRIVLGVYGAQASTGRILGRLEELGSPPHREMLRAIGLALAERGDVDAARPFLTQVFQIDAQDARVALILGDIAATTNERETFYRQALLIAPEWAHARANLASFLLSQNQAEAALEFTRGYEETSPDLLHVHAQALLDAGHYEDAVIAFDLALAQQEELQPDLLAGRWSAELRSGRREKALRTAQRGVRLFPEDSRWYLYLAATLRQLNRLEDAERATGRAILHNANQADVLKEKYEAALARHDQPKALHMVEQLIELYGEKNKDGKLGWAEGERLRIMLHMGLAEDALEFLNSEQLNASGWGDAAVIALNVEIPALALDLAEHALAQDPYNLAGLTVRAQSLADLDREHEALNALVNLRDVHPEEHHAYEMLALHLALEDNLDQALSFADHAVALGSYCPYAWAVRGAILFLRGEVESARSDLEFAWNRADAHSHEKSNLYWFLLHALQGQAQQAAARRQVAISEARSGFQRRLLALITERVLVG